MAILRALSVPTMLVFLFLAALVACAGHEPTAALDRGAVEREARTGRTSRHHGLLWEPAPLLPVPPQRGRK